MRCSDSTTCIAPSARVLGRGLVATMIGGPTLALNPGTVLAPGSCHGRHARSAAARHWRDPPDRCADRVVTPAVYARALTLSARGLDTTDKNQS
jgi:hypothetical protein